MKSCKTTDDYGRKDLKLKCKNLKLELDDKSCEILEFSNTL